MRKSAHGCLSSGTLDWHSSPFVRTLSMNKKTKCPSCGSAITSVQVACPSCGWTEKSEEAKTLHTPRSARGSQQEPKRVGEFRILRVIGRGGMGTVYEAYQESMHRNVALKIMDASAVPSRKEGVRFEREAWIGGRLSHPNVIKVYGHGVEGRSHYIAMELAGGESLHDLIGRAKERRKNVRSDSAWRAEHIRSMVKLFIGVADALEHVHESGVVHRDIKPANLLLSADGSRLMITDFGLARDEESSRMTRKGDLLGTIRYMSPEQLLASRVRITTKSDIWSLGMSLYESLTLKLPFSADSEEAYISALSVKEPSPARSQDAAIPRDLETVLMRCLERDPDRRYESAEKLRDDLERFLEGKPILARRPGPVARAVRFAVRRRRLVAVAAVAVVVAAVAMHSLVRSVQRRRDIERIEWTLTQTIKTGNSPRDIQFDWDELQPTLQSAVRRDPDGDLARLALLARARTGLSLPRHGLISEYVPVTVSTPWDPVPGVSFLYTADLEWCWDGGDWQPVASVISHDGRATYTSHERLDRLAEETVVTLGPHRVEARATVRFYEPEKALIDSLQGIGGRSIAFGDQRSAWPIVRERELLFSRSTDLPSLSINFFKEYPANFPYRVTGPAAIDSVLASFRIRALRVTRLRLPEGEGEVVSTEWERRGDPAVWSVREPSERATGHVVEFWLEGWVNGESELPVAAWATLELPGRDDPLFRFWVTAGLGRVGLVGAKAYPIRPVYWTGRDKSIGAQPVSGKELVLEDLGLVTIPESELADGVYRANLRLTPDRDIALSTYLYDRYLGEELLIPVELEITTRTGECGTCQ